jgi:hypothetical protein
LQLHKVMEKNLINDAPKKPNYDFVDHIRCLAIMVIVAEHSLGTYAFEPQDDRYWPYLGIIQFTKFGTISFFLLAGFLIGEKFTDYTPGQYLKRRFSSTFGPWLLWSLVYILCYVINLGVKGHMYHEESVTLANILPFVKTTYLYTNYWFIINFMVSIALLLVFKRYLYSMIFGAVLFAFTLFYCINIHYEWTDPSHTIAILGFIFFLWLGAQLRKNWHIVSAWLQRMPYWPVVLLVLLAYGFSLYEIVALKHNHSLDPSNTLRFSNILYSLTTFALFLKIRKFNFLAFLKPRETTFGIYLIHFILVVFLIPEIFRPFHLELKDQPLLPFFGIKFIAFLLAYFITWGLVMLLNKTKARRLVGN